MQKSPSYPLEILLVEPTYKNVEHVIRMLDTSSCNYTLHTTNNLNHAINYIKKEGKYSNKIIPDVIFINSTNLYLKNTITKNTTLLNIPVLFFKITKNKIEIAKAIDNNINYQMSNIFDINYFLEIIISIKKFVGSLVKPPEPIYPH